MAIRQYTKIREDIPPWIKIIKQYLLKPTTDIVTQIVSSTYPNLQQHMHNEEYLQKIVILTH